MRLSIAEGTAGAYPRDEMALPPPQNIFGRCCSCGEAEAVRMVLLDFEAPIPGTGWGCAWCKLPPDGAIAVLCDRCFQSGGQIERVCLGVPSPWARTEVFKAWRRFWHYWACPAARAACHRRSVSDDQLEESEDGSRERETEPRDHVFAFRDVL